MSMYEKTSRRSEFLGTKLVRDSDSQTIDGFSASCECTLLNFNDITDLHRVWEALGLLRRAVLHREARIVPFLVDVRVEVLDSFRLPCLVVLGRETAK